MKKFYLVTLILLIVAAFSLVAFGQVCTLEDLKAVNPGAEKFIADNPTYFSVKDGVVYETLTAGKDIPLPLPRIVKGRAPIIAYCTYPPASGGMKRHWHQGLTEAIHRGWVFQPYEGRDVMKQKESVETAITANVDAIVITYWTMPMLADVIIKARKAGIGVYVVDTELKPGVLQSSTARQGVGGAKAAYYILEDMHYRGKIAVVTIARELAERERRDTLVALMGTYGIEIVAKEDLTDPVTTADDTFKFTQDTLIKYGDQLSWIVGIADTLGIIISSAIEQSGLQDKVKTTGMDGSDQTFDMVRSNKGPKGSPLKIVAAQPYEWYTHMTFETINNLQVQGNLPLSEGSVIGISRIIFNELVLVTPENIPDHGTPIHTLFSNYPNDPYFKFNGEKWWEWTEAGGPWILGKLQDVQVYP